MEKSEQVNTAVDCTEEEATKMLGAHVSEDLYWEFKNAAAKRKEPLKVAICHAARMYIDAGKGKES